MSTAILDLGGQEQRRCEYATASYTTTTGASQENPTGFNFDIAPYSYASASFIVTSQSVKIQVFIANKSDFSDETGGTNQTCTVGTWIWTGSLNIHQAVPANTVGLQQFMRYVRFKVQDAVDGVHGSIAMTFFAKYS